MSSAGWLVALGLIAAPPEMITFDSAPFGKVPPGWSTAMTDSGQPPKWEILKDTTAPSQPYVLAQVSTGSEQNRSPLAILDRAAVKDGEVSVRFKPVAGREERAAGVVFRYVDSKNYYLVRADALENNISLYRVKDGKQEPLTPKTRFVTARGVTHDVPTGSWSTLKVVFRGPLLSVYFNHRRVLQAEDTIFSGPGKVGLWTRADSVTYFDDFRYAQR